MGFYEDKRVLVTGTAGMIGRHLMSALQNVGARIRVTWHERPLQDIGPVESVQVDLTRQADCLEVVKDVDYVFHLALARKYVEGASPSSREPDVEFNINMIMNTRILEACRITGVRRILICSSESVYPPGPKVCAEDMPLDHSPNPMRKSYSWVKRTVEQQARAYAEEFGYHTIAIVRPSIVYGPWDYFGPEGAAVVPALISRAAQREDPFLIWGDGEPYKDFIHARDVARGMMLALERYACCDPVNLGSGEKVKISELARMIIELADYNPEIVFDKTKPQGPSRVLSTEKARKVMGFEPQISLRDGLRETFDWYISNRLGSE
jgi:GDP-L-fucose synthase